MDKGKKKIETVKMTKKREKGRKKEKVLDNSRFDSVELARTRGTVSKAPRIRNDGKYCSISHSELLKTIDGSTSFTENTNLIINSGLAATFPWLSPIAAQWETYYFRRLSFEYISRSSATTNGSVLMYCDYDVLDAPAVNVLEAGQQYGAVENSSWKNFSCVLSPERMFPSGFKYTRTGSVQGDLKTYDGGRFLLYTSGQSSTSEIGRLMVHYDVLFKTPQMSPTSGNLSLVTKISFFHSNNTSQPIADNSPTALNFPNTSANALNIAYSNGVFTPPIGSYLVSAGADFGSTNGTQGTSISLFKNASSIITTGSSSTGSNVVNFGNYSTTFLQHVITANGSDTFRLMALVETPGTVVLTVDNASICFQLV